LNLKQIGQSLTENITSSVLKKGESSLFGSLGNLFGVGNKPDGSTAQNALWFSSLVVRWLVPVRAYFLELRGRKPVKTLEIW
jgi:hypothetical protein